MIEFRLPVEALIPLVAAVVIFVLAALHLNHLLDLVVLIIGAAALVTGHLLLRSRAHRHSAETEASRARAEAQLHARMADCEERRNRLAAFSRLAAQVAHEVRNPLSSMVLNTELLEDEVARCSCQDTNEAAALLRSIKAEGERLHALTDEYLAYSRLPKPVPGWVDAGAIASELAQLVREQAARSGVHIVLRLASSVLVVWADRDQVKQAVLNLIKNALEAMPDGGRLEISTMRSDRHVVIAIEDTGPGIPDDQRLAVFDPFFSTKTQGTGLGLPLALQIARDHGGDIEIGPGPQGGARFSITLPAGDRGHPPAELVPRKAACTGP